MEKKKYLYLAPSGAMVSRQRIWQLKKVAQGVCRICAGEIVKGKNYCEKHRIKAAEYGSVWYRNNVSPKRKLKPSPSP